MHINGESLNRRRSLHERWKGELIIKEGSPIDGTATPGKEGRHKQGQQPGLESSGRPTVGTIRPIWIITGTRLNFSADIVSDQCR